MSLIQIAGLIAAAFAVVFAVAVVFVLVAVAMSAAADVMPRPQQQQPAPLPTLPPARQTSSYGEFSPLDDELSHLLSGDVSGDNAGVTFDIEGGFTSTEPLADGQIPKEAGGDRGIPSER
ncbi:MAG TPA: hypothetical protein VMS17_09930 [Gemmataceae bacterium]|nr:hypothetical protein [Gemmataceae bacterium]